MYRLTLRIIYFFFVKWPWRKIINFRVSRRKFRGNWFRLGFTLKCLTFSFRWMKDFTTGKIFRGRFNLLMRNRFLKLCFGMRKGIMTAAVHHQQNVTRDLRFTQRPGDFSVILSVCTSGLNFPQVRNFRLKLPVVTC